MSQPLAFKEVTSAGCTLSKVPRERFLSTRHNVAQIFFHASCVRAASQPSLLAVPAPQNKNAFRRHCYVVCIHMLFRECIRTCTLGLYTYSYIVSTQISSCVKNKYKLVHENSQCIHQDVELFPSVLTDDHMPIICCYHRQCNTLISQVTGSPSIFHPK